MTKNKDLITAGRETSETVELKACFKDKPVTRRSLLSQGLITGAGYVAMPSIINTVFERRAYGQAALQCKQASAGGVMPGFMQFELSGGWAGARNFAWGKQKNGGAFVPLADQSYAQLGLGPTISPKDPTKIDLQIGGPMVAGSFFLQGLISATTAEARGKMTISAVANISADDTANNQLNLSQLAAQIVNAGSQQLVQLVGSNPNGRPNTFGRTAAVTVGDNAALSKAPVASSADVLSLVDPGLIGAKLSSASVQKISSAVKGMSESQLMKFQALSLPQQVADLVRCGYIGASELLGGIDQQRINPSVDLAVRNVPGLVNAQGVFANAEEERTATMAKLLADGMTAGATMEMNGYDYHGNTLAQTNASDFRAGRNVGIALQIAHLKGAPLFVAVSSDGSVSAPANGAPDAATGLIDPTSDFGPAGSILMITMNAGTAAANNNGVLTGVAGTRAAMNHYQVGAFNDNGAVDSTYLPAMAADPKLAAITVAANYAAFAGKMDNFRKMLQSAGQEDFIKDNVDYLAVRPKA
jgi:hypothetical protein